MLAKEMPNARLLQASSLTELRMHPERLTSEIAAFLDEVWGEPLRRAKPKAAASTRKVTAGKTPAGKRAPARRAASKRAPAKRAHA
jgi:hypothetical protein